MSLASKVQIKAGQTVHLVNTPEGFALDVKGSFIRIRLPTCGFSPPRSPRDRASHST
jgi:hypothetical protein